MKQVRIKIIDTDTSVLLENVTYDLSTEENQALKSSIVLSWDGSDDKYQSLMTSSLVFDLLVKDGSDGKFFHLYTGSEDRYKVDLSDENDALLWSGFLLPDQYSEPYKYPTLFVNMTATDCIGILKGKEFVDNAYYSQERSVIDFIATSLKLTGLTQDIYFSPAIVASNGYRWDEIFVSGKMYTDEPKLSEVDVLPSQKKDSVYDVLERLIHDLGCRLFTWKGKWFILGYNQQHKDLISCYLYNSNGVYQGVESLNQELTDVIFYAEPNITVVSPWKKVEVSADLDEDNDLFAADYITNRLKLGIGTLKSWDPNEHWQFIGNASFSPVPRDGKYIAVWTHEGQTIVDFDKTDPTNIGVAGVVTDTNVRGSYMELKNPVWVQGPAAVFGLKYLDFSLELVAYSRWSTKERYEDNEFGYLLRYEVLLNNEIIYSNFPDYANYVRDALELRYSDDSIEWGDDVYYNKNFIETRKKISGKIDKEKYLLSKSGWLQVRIYPPVLVNTKERTFTEVGIQAIKMKLRAKKEYEVFKNRAELRYSTKKEVQLFHIDNAQDNTNKRFIFKRPGIVEQKSWRESWKRNGVNEVKRYGDCYASMVHSVQPGVHIKVDGTAKGIMEPNSLFGFSWRGKKKFIPTRIGMNFSEGKTELTMIENVYEELFTGSGGLFG